MIWCWIEIKQYPFPRSGCGADPDKNQRVSGNSRLPRSHLASLAQKL